MNNHEGLSPKINSILTTLRKVYKTYVYFSQKLNKMALLSLHDLK